LARRADAEVEQVLADSSRADRACAATLAELEASARSLLRLVEPAAARRDALAQLGPAAFSRWLAAMPSADEAPSSVAQWWNAHTADEQDALLADPRLASGLGALDGLPFSVRDVVNRAALRRRLAGYSLALGQISRALDQLDDADPAVAGLLRRQRRLVRGHRIDLLVERQLTQLARERDAVTGRPLAVQLVLDDPERWDGKGRVAVSIGDADTASHVAYLVPGLGVRPDPDLGDLLADTRRVYDAARADASQAPTAVIAWLGYDTPGWAEVGFDSRALQGGALLAAAVNGLRAARLGDQPHVTVVGHSYGSTTVAAALQRLGAAVDDAVFLGSPGLLAQHATQLPIERQHLWVGAASGDEVSRLSRFGVDPAAAEFGARRFAAESPPGTSPFAQHLRYFDPGSQSLPNVARIVVGEGHLVRLTPGRTDHGYAGWLAAGLSALLPGAAPASILLARGLYPVTSDPGYG
jgi:hypothetical protein